MNVELCERSILSTIVGLFELVVVETHAYSVNLSVLDDYLDPQLSMIKSTQ